VSDKAFGELLKLVKNILPEGNELPESTYEAKKTVCPLGLEVQKIHACPNDCILYRGEYENLEACPAGAQRQWRRERERERVTAVARFRGQVGGNGRGRCGEGLSSGGAERDPRRGGRIWRQRSWPPSMVLTRFAGAIPVALNRETWESGGNGRGDHRECFPLPNTGGNG
jgi:hypothetical protein